MVTLLFYRKEFDMSGGCYNYGYISTGEFAHSMKADTVNRRAFAKLLHTVTDTMRAIEWCDSGDTAEEDAEEAIKELFKNPVTPDMLLVEEAKKMIEDLKGLVEKLNDSN